MLEYEANIHLLEPGRTITRFLTSVLACLFLASGSDSESDLLRTMPELEPAGAVRALLRLGKAGRTRPAAEPVRSAGGLASPSLEVTGTDISDIETLTAELPVLLTSALMSVEPLDWRGIN